MPEYGGNQPAGRKKDETDNEKGLGDSDRNARACGVARENRNKEHEGDHAQVLEDQYPHGEAADGAIHFCAVKQQFEYNGGAGEGNYESLKDGGTHRLPVEQITDRAGKDYRQAYLQGPSAEDDGPQLEKVLQREFETDGEHEEDDPDLSQYLDALDLLDEI